MIDAPLQKLTADQAVKLGLIDAIKNGEAVVTGTYSIDKHGKVDLQQRNFFFTSSDNEVILAKFVDAVEVLKFWEILGSE